GNRGATVTAMAEFNSTHEDIRPELRDKQRTRIEPIIATSLYRVGAWCWCDPVGIAPDREICTTVGGAEENHRAGGAVRENLGGEPYPGLATHKGQFDPRRSICPDTRRYA